MTRITIALIAALLSAGCISQNPHQPVYHYSIDAPTVAPIESSGEKLDVGLAVLDTRTSSRYGTKMLYKLPGGVIGFREYDRWVENPTELVSRATISIFIQSGAFKNVGGPSSLRWADYSLAGYIIRFDEIRDGATRAAEFSIRFSLNRVEGGDVVWAATMSARRDMDGEDGAAFASALGSAAGELLAEARQKAVSAVREDLVKREAEKTEEPDRENKDE